MSQLPDLVRDSKLETSFVDRYAIHSYDDDSEDEQSTESHRREEYWESKHRLAQGGSGDVWLQRCTKGRRHHEWRAVKVLSTTNKQIKYGSELEAIAKFSQKRYSKYFVKLLGWYDDEEHLFIAMEYFPLGDLQEHMSNNPPMGEPDVRAVVYQVLGGLDLMHQEGFAHRDIKPSNVLIKSKPPSGSWRVKISDFGISKRIESSSAWLSTMKGTVPYMAPELFGHEPGSSHQVDHFAADMWSVGELVFRMLTKRATFPLHGDLFCYLARPDTFPSEELVNYGASDRVDAFLRSVMVPMPTARLSAKEALAHPWFHPSRVEGLVSNSSPVPTAITPMVTPESHMPDPWATVTSAGSDVPNQRSPQISLRLEQRVEEDFSSPTPLTASSEDAVTLASNVRTPTFASRGSHSKGSSEITATGPIRNEIYPSYPTESNFVEGKRAEELVAGPQWTTRSPVISTKLLGQNTQTRRITQADTELQHPHQTLDSSVRKLEYLYFLKQEKRRRILDFNFVPQCEQLMISYEERMRDRPFGMFIPSYNSSQDHLRRFVLIDVRDGNEVQEHALSDMDTAMSLSFSEGSPIWGAFLTLDGYILIKRLPEWITVGHVKLRFRDEDSGSIAFDFAGRYFAHIGDKNIEIWGFNRYNIDYDSECFLDAKTLMAGLHEKGGATSVEFSKDGQWFAVRGSNEITIWKISPDIEKGLNFLEWTTIVTETIFIASRFLSEGAIFTYCDIESIVGWIDLSRQPLISKKMAIFENTDSIDKMAASFSPDGQLLVLLESYRLTLYDSTSDHVFSVTDPATRHANESCEMKFSPDGKYLAICYDMDRISVWRVR